MVTGDVTAVKYATVRVTLQKTQVKYRRSHNKSHKVKKPRALVHRERCWVMGKNNNWTECLVTGLHEDDRSYEIEIEDIGRQVRRNLSRD